MVAGTVAIGIMFAFVFPVRTYVAQRRAIGATEAKVQVLTEQDRQLTARAQELRSDSEIERLARQEYGMVRPGEVPYAILPAPGSDPGRLPTVAGDPVSPPRSDDGLVDRVLDALTFWD